MSPVRIVPTAHPADQRQEMEITRSGLVVPSLAPSSGELAARRKADIVPTLRPEVQDLVISGLNIDLAVVLSGFLDQWFLPNRPVFSYPDLPNGAAETLVRLGLVTREPGMGNVTKGFSPTPKLRNPPKVANKSAGHAALHLDRRLR